MNIRFMPPSRMNPFADSRTKMIGAREIIKTEKKQPRRLRKQFRG
jgi:hypothetical protein